MQRRRLDDQIGKRGEHRTAESQRPIDLPRDFSLHDARRIGRSAIGFDEPAHIGMKKRATELAHRSLCLACKRRTAAANCSRPVRSR